MKRCPKCDSTFISFNEDMCVGWRTIADKCYCSDCSHEWYENERNEDELED